MTLLKNLYQLPCVPLSSQISPLPDCMVASHLLPTGLFFFHLLYLMPPWWGFGLHFILEPRYGDLWLKSANTMFDFVLLN